MPKTVIKNIFDNRVLYSTCLLALSLFSGQAPMSIAFFIWVLTFPVSQLKMLSLKNWEGKLILLPILYGFFGIIVSISHYKEFDDIFALLKYLPFIVIPPGIWLNKKVWKPYKNVRLLYWAYLSSALFTLALSLLYGIYRSIVNGNSIYMTYNHLVEIFGVQPIYLSLFYLIAILFSSDLYFKELKYRKGYIFSIIFFLLGIVLLGSRSSLFIAVLVLVTKFFIESTNKKRFRLVVTGGILVGVLLISLIPTLQKRFTNFDANVAAYSGTNFRFKIWQNALEVASDAPILGYGYSNSQDALQTQYEKVNFRRAYIAKMNAHNQYLQSLIDTGFFGLTLLLLMILLPFGIRKQSLNAVLFWIIVAVAFVTESFFRRQFGVIFYTLFFSYFISSSFYTGRLKNDDADH